MEDPQRMPTPDIKTFTRELGGKTLSIEHGRVAGLAGGAVLIRYGDTVAMCTATMARQPRPNGYRSYAPPAAPEHGFLPADHRLLGEDVRRGQDPGQLLPPRRPPQHR